MATQQNAKLSLGPVTEEGSIAFQINNFRHGLAVKHHESFSLLMEEIPEKFQELLNTLCHEHNPTSETELILCRRMARAEWLRARALRFQTACMLHGEKAVDCLHSLRNHPRAGF